MDVRRVSLSSARAAPKAPSAPRRRAGLTAPSLSRSIFSRSSSRSTLRISGSPSSGEAGKAHHFIGGAGQCFEDARLYLDTPLRENEPLFGAAALVRVPLQFESAVAAWAIRFALGWFSASRSLCRLSAATPPPLQLFISARRLSSNSSGASSSSSTSSRAFRLAVAKRRNVIFALAALAAQVSRSPAMAASRPEAPVVFACETVMCGASFGRRRTVGRDFGRPIAQPQVELCKIRLTGRGFPGRLDLFGDLLGLPLDLELRLGKHRAAPARSAGGPLGGCQGIARLGELPGKHALRLARKPTAAHPRRDVRAGSGKMRLRLQQSLARLLGCTFQFGKAVLLASLRAHTRRFRAGNCCRPIARRRSPRHQPLAGPEGAAAIVRLLTLSNDPICRSARLSASGAWTKSIKGRAPAAMRIVRIVAGIAPVRRAPVPRGESRSSPRAAPERRLEAALDFHLLDDGRISAAAGRLQHAPDRSRFRLDAVQPPRASSTGGRAAPSSARLGESLFDGGDGGLGLLQRRLRKLHLPSLLVRIGEARHLTVKLVDFAPLNPRAGRASRACRSERSRSALSIWVARGLRLGALGRNAGETGFARR